MREQIMCSPRACHPPTQEAPPMKAGGEGKGITREAKNRWHPIRQGVGVHTVESALMCWSGGKDSALSLYTILQHSSAQVKALLTTVTRDYERISMHGVRCRLLQQQARAIGLPLEVVHIRAAASNASYEEAMDRLLVRYKARGISSVIFGDIFLRDIRGYRERQLARRRLRGIFPLWLKDTRRLAGDFIDAGFRARIVCVDPKQVDPSLCGREFDSRLLSDLPSDVDPCGEKGEFHTFVYDGPIFRHPVPVTNGAVVNRQGFWFCDLQPSRIKLF